MDTTIQNFLTALSNVQQRDYNIHQNGRGNGERTYENNFVTKLNGRYDVLCELNRIREPEELNRQFQLPKMYIFAANPLPGLWEGYEKLLKQTGEKSDINKELTLIPDFIIHKDQTDRQYDNQRFIAEVKTVQYLTYEDFLWDFFKLNLYMEAFNFQTAAFLSVRTNSKRIYGFVQDYIRTVGYFTNRDDKLYIVNKRDFDAKTECKTLRDFR